MSRTPGPPRKPMREPEVFIRRRPNVLARVGEAPTPDEGAHERPPATLGEIAAVHDAVKNED